MKRFYLPMCGLMLAICLQSTLNANDIVETAQEAGSFKTLLAAVEAADLTHTLQEEGPFTVFAPTDEAFAKLPKETIEFLLKPENKSQLAAILTYHVVPGAVKAKDVYGLDQADTANGQRLNFKLGEDGLTVSGARIVATDIETDNGVIHVIDTVMLPSSKTVVETAIETPGFETLVKLVTAADLGDALSSEGPFTVFAPSDDAFASLPKELVAELLKPENKSKLQNILKYHVVSGRIYADQAVQAGDASTLQGQSVAISFGANGLTVNESRIIATDIQTSNGVIHVIDQVLLPQALTKEQARQTLENAVQTGARLFNHGDFRECCDKYVEVCDSLVSDGGELPSSSVEILTATLERARSIRNSQQKAWVLRQGIDLAYFTLK